MHSVLAAIQPIVFDCNVKVRHVLCNMYVCRHYDNFCIDIVRIIVGLSRWWKMTRI